MFLFMMIATCYGVLQLAVLGSLTRSVRIANLLLAVTVGLYGCGAVAVLLQILYTRTVASLTGTPVNVVVRTASFTTDPVIEEVVKVLPLLVLVLFRRIRAQWSLTDYLLLGAGTGAGFALVEATMRWSHRASGAIGDLNHGWTVGISLFGDGQHIPAPFDILQAWLPAPVGDAVTNTNLHLVWSALAGFGVGLLVRGRGWRRLLGLLPWLYSALDHMAYNHYLVRPGEGGEIWFFSGPVRLLEHLLWLLPLALLVVAGLLDWREIRAGKAALPDVLLPAERAGQPTIAVLGRFATVGLPWTPFIAMRFALVRRSLMYAQARNAAVAEQLHGQVRSVRDQIERASDAAVWRALSARRAQAAPVRPQGNVLRRYWQPVVSLVLVLPSLLFLILGGFPSTSGIQRLFASPVVFKVLTVFSVATLVMVAWSLVRTVRGFPSAFRQPYADPAVSVTFRSGVGAGALGVGALSLSNVLRGAGPTQPAVSNMHILDAISQMTNILGYGLMALSLLALFAAFMGGTGGLGGALVAAVARIGVQELLQMIAIAGIGTLGALGLILAMASGGDGSGGGHGDGSGEGESSGDDESESERQAREDRERREQYDDKYGDDPGNDNPGDQRISDGNKAELQDSGWLKEQVPDADTRRQFMDWLERGHNQGEAHVHLRPGSREAAQALEEFFKEYPELRP
jgi:PrsW family intramembrane metalloprotease